MNVYDVFISGMNVYNGVSYKTAQDIFTQAIKSIPFKCKVCPSKSCFVSCDIDIDLPLCTDGKIEVDDNDTYMESDGEVYRKAKCIAKPVTREHIMIRCTDTDTGKITEVGG